MNPIPIEKEFKTKRPFSKDTSHTLDILRELYRDVSGSIPSEERHLINVIHRSDECYVGSYGEVCSEMINCAKLGENDVFVDLGSGLGKVVLQVAMEANVKKAIGIELSKTRFKHAQDAVKRLCSFGFTTPVEFYQTDFLTGVGWEDATVIYSWAQCFRHLLPEMAELARRQCKNLRLIILRGCAFTDDVLSKNRLKLKSCHHSYVYYEPY